MLLEICTKCKNRIAISPQGLCNICDEQALQKRKAAVLLAVHRTNVPPIKNE